MFDLAVHGGGGAKGGADVDLHQPRFEVAVDEDVEAVELEPASPPFLGLGVDVEHDWLCTDARLDDNVFDVFKELNRPWVTLSVLMPMSS